MVKNNYVLQRLSDVLNDEVHRPAITETTALGAAYMAGLQQGVFDSLDAIAAKWRLERAFTPRSDKDWRSRQYAGWQDAVARIRSQR